MIGMQDHTRRAAQPVPAATSTLLIKWHGSIIIQRPTYQGLHFFGAKAPREHWFCCNQCPWFCGHNTGQQQSRSRVHPCARANQHTGGCWVSLGLIGIVLSYISDLLWHALKEPSAAYAWQSSAARQASKHLIYLLVLQTLSADMLHRCLLPARMCSTIQRS